MVLRCGDKGDSSVCREGGGLPKPFQGGGSLIVGRLDRIVCFCQQNSSVLGSWGDDEGEKEAQTESALSASVSRGSRSTDALPCVLLCVTLGWARPRNDRFAECRTCCLLKYCRVSWVASVVAAVTNDSRSRASLGGQGLSSCAGGQVCVRALFLAHVPPYAFSVQLRLAQRPSKSRPQSTPAFLRSVG